MDHGGGGGKESVRGPVKCWFELLAGVWEAFWEFLVFELDIFMTIDRG